MHYFRRNVTLTSWEVIAMTKDLVLNMDKKGNRYEKINKDVREAVHKTERQLCDVYLYAGLLLFKPDISNIDF